MSGPGQQFIELVEMARGYQRSQALAVVAQLGIADLLREGDRSVEDLAGLTNAHAPTLYRLLRALASVGVFFEHDDGRFALTPKGDLLRSDHPHSLRPAAMMFCGDYEWKAWGELIYSVRTGENAAVHALGMDVWEHRRLHPEDGEVFDAAMRTFTRSSAPGEIAAYDFGRHRVVADIGGGTGALLVHILEAHPGVQGILFDQPDVVAGAPDVLADSGVADRVEIVAGSFFDQVPAGADAYVLRRILHDWPDPECVRILERIRQVISPAGRLLVVDAIVGPPNEDPLVKFLDLMMLVSAGGRERTGAEWEELLAIGGFRLAQTTRGSANSHVLEAIPA